MRSAGQDYFRAVTIAATTWWPAPARLARAFAKLGIEVTAICPAGHPLRKTSAVSRLASYRPLRPILSLAGSIEKFRPDLIIACDDRVVEHCIALHANGDEWTRNLVRRSVGAPENYPLLANRHALMRLAHAEGIRIPDTLAAVTSTDTERVSFDFPWVVKSSGTWGGAGVRVVTSSAEAEAAITSLRRPLGAARAFKRMLVNRDGFWIASWLSGAPHEVVVQAHVAGTPANIAFVCHQGKVLSSVSVRVLRSQGQTGPASVAEIIDHPEMASAAERLARRLGLSGFHGLDFIIDNDGAAWLLELNPRATQLCHFAVKGGASLAEVLTRHARGESASFPAAARPGACIAFFPQAWRAEPQNPLLRTEAHDVPWEDPALVAELMCPPWPNRGLLAQAWQKLCGAGDPNGAWAGAAPVSEPLETEDVEQAARQSRSVRTARPERVL